jgi:hypothetical protein
MNLYDEFSRIVTAIQKKKIRFAVVDGLAMAFYDEPRFTRDINLLVQADDEETAVNTMIMLGYFEPAKPLRFKKMPITLSRFVRARGEEFIFVDILVGKKKHIDAMVENAIDQPWSRGTIPGARKADIITLKKGRGSEQDKVDIRKLKK